MARQSTLLVTLVSLLCFSLLPLSVVCQTSNFTYAAPQLAQPSFYSVFSYLSPFIELLNSSPPHITGASISPREGSSYTDDGDDYLHVAGGVNTVQNQAFADVFVLATVEDAIYLCTNLLPTPQYYGLADFIDSSETFYSYGGLQNLPNSPAQYITNLYKLNFSQATSANPCNGATTTTITPTPTVPVGRQWPGGMIIPGTTSMLVYGGYNSQSPIPTSQQFFSLDVNSGAVVFLSMAPSRFVHPGVIDPMVMIDREADEVLFFSGWQTLYSFEPTRLLYRYDNEVSLVLFPHRLHRPSILPTHASHFPLCVVQRVAESHCPSAESPLGLPLRASRHRLCGQDAHSRFLALSGRRRE